MAALTIASFLIGAVIGTRCRVIALGVVMGAMLPALTLFGVGTGLDFAMILSALGICAVALQLGYIAGIFTHSVMANSRVSRLHSAVTPSRTNAATVQRQEM